IGAVSTTANTTTLNLATSTGAAQTVNIGDTNGAGAVTIKAGSGNISLNAGNATTAGSVVVKPGKDTTTAFQLQNAVGTGLFTADTSNLALNVTGNVNIGSLSNSLLFGDDFESGNLSHWGTTSGTVSASTTQAHNGTYS